MTRLWVKKRFCSPAFDKALSKRLGYALREELPIGTVREATLDVFEGLPVLRSPRLLSEPAAWRQLGDDTFEGDSEDVFSDKLLSYEKKETA